MSNLFSPIYGGSLTGGVGGRLSDANFAYRLDASISGVRLNARDTFELSLAPTATLFSRETPTHVGLGAGLELGAAVRTPGLHVPVAIRAGVGYSTAGLLVSAGVDVPIPFPPVTLTNHVALSANYLNAGGGEHVVTLGIRGAFDLGAQLEQLWRR